MRLFDRGTQEPFNSVTVPCTCRRCGADVRWVRSADPVGYSTFERRLIIECVRCGWAGKFVTSVEDLGGRSPT